jgi:putative sterol carrier protein
MPTIKELFESMPQAFDPEKAPGINAVVQISLSGDQAADYHVSIADGKCQVNEGEHESPTATLRMDSEDYMKLISGKLNPMMAFSQGKIKISGDMGLLLKFQNFFNLPGAG